MYGTESSAPWAQYLPKFLNLQTPGDSKDAPSIFEFERFREFEVNWHEITSQQTVEGSPETIDDIKEYFLNSWKSATRNEFHDVLFSDDQPFYFLRDTANPAKQVFWQVADVYLNGDSQKLHAQTVCIVHKPSQRLFVFVDKSFVPATLENLGWDQTISNKDAWEGLDKQGFFFSLMQAYVTGSEARELSTTTTYIKREAILFKEEFERLNSQKKFVDMFNEKSDTFIKEEILGKPENFKILWNEDEELTKTADVYANLKTKGFSLHQKMRQLASKVKEYGYYLALDSEIVKVPNGEGGLVDKELTPGAIYQIKQDTYLRRDVIRRQEWRKVKDGKDVYWQRVWIEVPDWVPTAFQAYIELELLKDPVQTAVVNLKAQEYFVYFADLKGGGFYTEENIPLATILKRCEDDEEFRRKCVVVIPQYDYLISNKSYYVGAFIFKFPIPGLIPTAYPRIGIREELSYRLAWEGIELGQLISTINLAPGETRTITVSSKFKQTTAQTASFKSVNDVNTNESFDLATEFQKEASQEFNRNESFKASASGGYGAGPFSASASASGSKSTNLKTFSKEMSRVAKKTSQSINRKISQEITSTTATTTEVSQETSKSITITNINKGTTLNLLFYQINNKYKAATHLTGLELLVSSTKELIAGSGIYETYSYRTNEIWPAIFERLHPDLLPGKNPKPTETCPDVPDFSNEERLETGEDPWCFYWRSLQSMLTKALHEEYEDNEKPETARVIRFTDSSSFRRIAKHVIEESGGIESVYSSEKNKVPVTDDFYSGSNLMGVLDGKLNICKYFKILQMGLRNIEILDYNALSAEYLIIASGGLYVDALLGIVPATEPYSENMRQLEALRVRAEIDKLSATNDEIQAKTNLILSGETFIKHLYILKSEDKSQLLLQLTKGISDLDQTHWEVYFDNNKMNNCEIEIPGSAPAIVITVTWLGEVPPLEELESRFLLRNKVDNQTLRKI